MFEIARFKSEAGGRNEAIRWMDSAGRLSRYAFFVAIMSLLKERGMKSTHNVGSKDIFERLKLRRPSSMGGRSLSRHHGDMGMFLFASIGPAFNFRYKRSGHLSFFFAPLRHECTIFSSSEKQSRGPSGRCDMLSHPPFRQ